MKVVVLAGGLSDERDVSLSSSSLIANALIENGHQVVLIDVYNGMKDTTDFESAHKKYGQAFYKFQVPTQKPDLKKIKTEQNNQKELIGPNVLSVCQTADIVYLGLHGSIGENGQIQATLDVFNISYTGTGYLGSVLAMDKKLAKELFVAHQIPTPKNLFFSDDNLEAITLPCVIKPNSNGSSIGVEIITKREELADALERAAQYEDDLLIEEKIVGREFAIGILDKQALPVIEIIPQEGFYDYVNKYQIGATKEICPAELSVEKTSEMQELALKVHQILRLGVYSRIDFLMNENEELYCIEANTLPGMTPTSLFPQEARAIGISYNELCETIIQLSN